MGKHDAMNDFITKMLMREGYTVTQADKGWTAHGLLPRHRRQTPYRSEEDAWKACREDYYWRKEHPSEK
jgi:hypothetical protein